MSEFVNTISVLGDDAVIDSIIERTITEFKDDVLTDIGEHAFYNCTALKVVDLPEVQTIGHRAFTACAMEVINFPKAKAITGDDAFASNKALREAVFPSLQAVHRLAFDYCSSLEKLDLYVATTINYDVNRSNSNFTTLIIRTPSVCTIMTSDPLGNGCFAKNAYAYVPASLVDSYKAATNWSSIADRIRAIEDYPDICGG